MKCIHSHEDGAYCDKHDHGAVTVGCCGEESCPDREVLTNADRLRSMTDEELADYHTKMCGCPPGHDPIFCGIETIGCKGCWLSCLKAPVEVDG